MTLVLLLFSLSLFSFALSSRCVVHSRHTDQTTVRITGPKNSPTKPNASKPPRTPKSTSKKGIALTLLINIGRSTLSSWLTTAAPHIQMPIASAVLPCISSHKPAEPQASGVQNGISASMAVTMPKITGDDMPATQ